MSDGLLVIGSGPAGVSAAQAYRDAGGPGPIRVVSADEHPPYQRPPLSKDVLRGDAPPEPVPIDDDDPDLRGITVELRTRVDRVDTDARVVHAAGQTGDEDRVEISPVLRLIVDVEQVRRIRGEYARLTAGGVTADGEEEGDER